MCIECSKDSDCKKEGSICLNLSKDMKEWKCMVPYYGAKEDGED